jgi:hypothetical protein
MLELIIELGDELRIALGGGVRLLQFIECGDQGFSDEDTTIGAKMASGVWQIVIMLGHQQSPCDVLRQKPAGFTPGFASGKSRSDRASPRPPQVCLA